MINILGGSLIKSIGHFELTAASRGISCRKREMIVAFQKFRLMK